MSAKKVAQKVRRDQYPAPYAIIDLWKDFGGDVRNVPPDHPASMAKIFEHPTARNLIRLFTLQERLKGFGKQEGVRHPAPARDRRRRHGRRHRGVVRVEGHHRHAAGPAPERIAPAVKRAAGSTRSASSSRTSSRWRWTA
jgi:3-hydroxyacyl-CoA dehydrogenase/enoyl-CoA hydratase/3-hydroxybutyryl-CoA epimerase